MKKLIGKVTWFCDQDGNGIIMADDFLEYYTDISGIIGRKNLKRGALVEFVLNTNIRGTLCAMEVKEINNEI